MLVLVNISKFDEVKIKKKHVCKTFCLNIINANLHFSQYKYM